MFLLRTYYQLKPFLPFRLRLALRRWRAARRRPSFATQWPILPSAGVAPRGWAGWPDGKKFAFVLTHDVEGHRGLEQSRALADFEIARGFRSSFNFVPQGEYPLPSEFRHFLVQHGFEVGVHDLKHDGKLYWSRAAFHRQAQEINRYLREWDAVGFRSGFMRHELEWLHDLDVLYDSSTFDTDPFEPQPDGAGTIFPFWVTAPPPCGSRPAPQTDPGGRRFSGGYLELPYTLPQDFCLFLLLRETTIDIWKQKLDWIADHGGMAMIDLHPDYVDFTGTGVDGVSFPVRFYGELLDYVRQKYSGQYWSALPRQVAEHCLSQNRPVLQIGGKPALV